MRSDPFARCAVSIHREYRAGRIERVSPGYYVLAPPKPPTPPEPPPPAAVKMMAAIEAFAWPSDLGGETEDQWFAALEAWDAAPSTWDAVKLGPPPDQADHKVPLPILSLFRDRIRKRQERQREAKTAAARQRQADAELRDELIAACQGNVIRSARLDDVSCIRAALETVPLDIVLAAIRSKTDRKIFPGNEPAVSWREERLLRAIAERFARFTLAPAMASAWGNAGMAPGKSADESDASTANQAALAGKRASCAPTSGCPPSG